MFGLEDEKGKMGGKGLGDFSFDLEDDLRDKAKYLKIKERVHERLYKIKNILRTGEMKQDFEKLGHLVYGYAALLKVMARATAPKK